MQSITLDSGALLAAAASIGITDREGLVAHLGMEITRPASLQLIATVLVRLPVTLSSAVIHLDGTCEYPPPHGR